MTASLKDVVRGEIRRAVEATPFRLLIIARNDDGEGNGPDAMVYALTESGELLTECTDADTAVHLIVARDPEDGQYYPVDSRTITDDIDVTVERGPDDVPAQVPIVKEQHLLDAVNLALAASEGGTDDHRDGEEDQPGSARSMA